MFRNRRQLRRWAARVLLVWLFGVASGVANACWTEGYLPADAAHADAAAAAPGAAAVPECELHSGSQPDAHQAAPAGDQSQAKSHCKTYCDAVTVSITPLKTSLDNTPVHAMAVATIAFAAPVAGASPVHLLGPRRDAGPPRTSIRIAFLRLAL